MVLLPEYLEDGVELLSDMLRSTLDQNEFDTEKKVILEEIALYKDRPVHILFEKTLATHFANHPAGSSVLGTTDSISALSREQMLNYFQSRYQPSNMVFTASGNFEPEKLFELVENYTSHWKGEEVSRDRPEFSAKPAKEVVTKADLQMTHMCVTSEGLSADDDRRYPLQVLCSMMGDGTGSRTYWELVDKGLVDSASIGSDEMDKLGFVYAYASCLPENKERVSKKLIEILTSPENLAMRTYLEQRPKLPQDLSCKEKVRLEG